MNVENLHDLFVSELERLHTVETTLVEELATLEADTEVDSLDDLRDTGGREALLEVIAEHTTETRTQVERLEEALEALGRTPNSRSIPALEGLIEEKELFNNVILNDAIRPLFYVGTCKQIERLEIDAYERLLEVGAHLDVPDEVIDALTRNLEEEKETLGTLESISKEGAFDSLLDTLAESPDFG